MKKAKRRRPKKSARVRRDLEETVSNWILVGVAALIIGTALYAAVAIVASPSLVYECIRRFFVGDWSDIDVALACF